MLQTPGEYIIILSRSPLSGPGPFHPGSSCSGPVFALSNRVSGGFLVCEATVTRGIRFKNSCSQL